MESNHLPSGYEPPALTDELQPRECYYTSVASVGLYGEGAIITKVSHKLLRYAKDKHTKVHLPCPPQVCDV